MPKQRKEHPTKVLKLSQVAVAMAVAGLSLPAQAGQDHWDTFSCYAYAHDQCFPSGGDAKCPQDAYEDGLDQCDGYYEESATRPTRSGTFASRINPRVQAKILASFKKK